MYSARTCALFTCTHTYKHVHIYICIQTCAHRIPAGYTLLDDDRIHGYRKRVCALFNYSHAHIHTNMYTYTYVHTHTEMPIGVHPPRVRFESRAIKSARMRALFNYSHTYIHTNIYTFIYVYTHTHRCPSGYTLLDYDLNPGLSKARACVLYSRRAQRISQMRLVVGPQQLSSLCVENAGEGSPDGWQQLPVDLMDGIKKTVYVT